MLHLYVYVRWPDFSTILLDKFFIYCYNRITNVLRGVINLRERLVYMNKGLNLRRLATVAVCVALFGQVAYASPEDSKALDSQILAKTSISETTLAVNSNEKITMGTVTDGPLNVRQAPGTDQAIVGKLYAGQTVTISKTENNWHSISANGITGWVSGDYVGNIKTLTAAEYKAIQESQSAKAENVVALAKQQLGKPYVYGATGPNAFDCSGFVKYVYGNLGVSVPRTSKEFVNVGTAVSRQDIQPGDIIALNCNGSGVSHVGIYVGNSQMIHASTGGRGVVYDNINSAYYSPRIVKIVRVL